jgi:hypothetical protein
VEKPVELATQILKKYKNGMNEKLEAMNGGEEKWYILKSCLHWLFYRLGR